MTLRFGPAGKTGWSGGAAEGLLKQGSAAQGAAPSYLTIWSMLGSQMSGARRGGDVKSLGQVPGSVGGGALPNGPSQHLASWAKGVTSRSAVARSAVIVPS